MIVHVDMDAFYASVEQRDNPSLRNRPVAVGGSAEGRGVVAAASYEARRFGIHSAMSMRKAVQLCPSLAIVRPRIDHYAQVSHAIRSIFERFTPIIEPLSFDEAFLDVTPTAHLFGGPESIANQIQSQIRSELELAASVGVAPNKFVAKVASDLHKPNALVVVHAADIQSFLDPLPIERIWGIGEVTAAKFRKLSIRTIGQLRQMTEASLAGLFGNAANHYWSLSRGIDDRSVVPDREAKSISSETTFAADISDRDALLGSLLHLVESVARRLRHYQSTGKGIEVKARYADFHSITRSMMLQQPTNVTADLIGAANKLFVGRIPDDGKPLRLIGFGVHHLSQSQWQQPSLFEDEQQEQEKQRKLDSVTDKIAEKFGRAAILRGALGRKKK
jgi:DNA polymerase IV